MTDTATLQARLAEAEAAEHALMTGQQVASVNDGAKQVSYQRSSLTQLRGYIALLRQQLGLPDAGRAPLRPLFNG